MKTALGAGNPLPDYLDPITKEPVPIVVVVVVVL
jgi:hypothetical protein